MTADNAIPGLDINPPNLDEGTKAAKTADKSEGLGGWISGLVQRGKGEGDSSSKGYRRVDQEED